MISVPRLNHWLPVLFALLALATPTLAAANDCLDVASASGDEDGIGGTGILGDEDGIGGTGVLGDEDGIGGTGLLGDEDGIGGTGVFGTVTGFASLCVNGLEVHFDPDVSVSRNGEPAGVESLALGQVVWVVADVRERRLVAESIQVLSALVGPVGSLDSERRILEVAGEVVEVRRDAVLFGEPAADLALEIGAWVEVSGLRRPNGSVVATRIDRAVGAQRSSRLHLDDLVRETDRLRWISVEGYLGALRPDATFGLSGLAVDTSALPGAAAAPKTRVWVSGALRGTTLRAERIVPPPASIDLRSDPAGPFGTIDPGAKDPTGRSKGAKEGGTRIAVPEEPDPGKTWLWQYDTNPPVDSETGTTTPGAVGEPVRPDVPVERLPSIDRAPISTDRTGVSGASPAR